MNSSIIVKGRTAVITGAAKGIGAAAAKRLSEAGMNLCLFDRDEKNLKSLADALDSEIRLVTGDVTSLEDIARLRDTAINDFGDIALLINNAAISHRSGPWGDPDDWRSQLEGNLLSILNVQHLFVPEMLKMDGRSAIVNLGSKQGITTPPGNNAYNVSKAGVKIVTEQLAHDLFKECGNKITAHLLVPGYTWTPMNFPEMDEQHDERPKGTWKAEQVIEYFIEHFSRGDFYIICPDGTVTSEIDAKRITWAYEDIIQNRPALSRWHPDWKDKFEEFMNS
ncbi:SDR family NAD(P)-dependent oxidoreductase [Klebsiella pneumoniae]|uniref:SDR family NAD(P)-dependent oxidoreductase n=1 Tax=Klebsiella pneumoniae TaxID=573 RepID=UPI002072ED05|nr:SDR family oxidoreductase [Klebsiella pneumoniae]MCJ4922737.1 SDR family oxidoreductase [Klebsiella pneumoniae]MCM5966314.1 SDR family oxidoreductase [Klebsiella pneumoniae]MCQ8722388.1 SDR family oxidoreductase [Klebsiella pneumoniae]MCW9351879.1 SDR family oxidoreductase [Klebsiella pneumoniae]MDR4659270.1 SDR family NAD(P)-dependent oxidoreductase [Klebsiella pneumoniae]